MLPILPDLTPQQADQLALKIAPEHRAEEVALMRSRWWDYRLLHPTWTTYAFASAYQCSHIEWHRRFVDIDEADKQLLWPTGDIFKEKDLTAIWLARQAADRVGVPYPFVCSFAMQRALTRQFKRPMRPNQLYGEEFELDLAAAWKEHLDTQMPMPSVVFFRGSQFTRHPVQLAFREWLVSRVNSRPAPRYRILAWMLLDDLVNDALLQEHWPEERDMTIAYSLKLRQES